MTSDFIQKQLDIIRNNLSLAKSECKKDIKNLYEYLFEYLEESGIPVPDKVKQAADGVADFIAYEDTTPLESLGNSIPALFNAYENEYYTKREFASYGNAIVR